MVKRVKMNFIESAASFTIEALIELAACEASDDEIKEFRNPEIKPFDSKPEYPSLSSDNVAPNELPMAVKEEFYNTKSF